MSEIRHLTNLVEALEEAALMRENAATIQRLRGVIATRYRLHPNAALMAQECAALGEHYTGQFDRLMLAILNQAITYEQPESEEAR